MGLWESLLVSLIIVPIAFFSIFWTFKLLDKKKISSQEVSQGVIRTHPPKTLSGFFLGFALIVLVGGTAALIYYCITDREHATTLVIITLSVCIAAFSVIGFFGYASLRFNYIVTDTEGIFVYRLFRKKRYYRFEEIGYFQDSTNLGMMGRLIGYDKNNVKIFAIEAHIGASAVAQRLREHGVQEKPSGWRFGI